MGFEYFGNAHAGGGFDFRIGVDKSQFQSFGQTRAEAGLTGPHHANQYNRLCYADFLHNYPFPS